MVAFLDVVANDEWSNLKNTGLEPLLKKFGVEVNDSFVMAIREGLLEPATLFATGAKSEHILAKKFALRTFAMKKLARGIKPVEMARGFKVEPVLQLIPQEPDFAVIETEVRVLRQDLGVLYPGQARPNALGSWNRRISTTPIPVALAVSEEGKPGGDEKPRLVVIADTEFLGNFDLQRSRTQKINYAFAVQFARMARGAARASACSRAKTCSTCSTPAWTPRA